MHAKFYKVLSVALVVALLFWQLVPFPVGVGAVDDRIEEAEAVAPAIPLIVVAGTALAACGVYVAGTTLDSYDGNVESIISDVQSAWEGMGNTDFEAALLASVTGAGTISLGTLKANGILAAIQEVAQSGVQSGTMTIGQTNTAIQYSESVTIDGNSFRVTDSLPSGIEALVAERNPSLLNDVIGYHVVSRGTSLSGTYIQYQIILANDGYDGSWTYAVTTSGGVTRPGLRVSNVRYASVNLYVEDENYEKSKVGSPLSASTRYVYAIAVEADGIIKNRNYPAFYINNSNDYTMEKDSEGIEAAVEQGFVDDGASGIPDGDVNPWEPTVETLEAGYSAADVYNNTVNNYYESSEPIDDSGTEDIEAAIAALNPNIARILAALTGVGGIGTMIASINSRLLAVNENIGETHDQLDGIEAGIGTAAGTIGTGIDELGDTVSSVGETVTAGIDAGVRTLGQTLSGIEAGVRTLDGTLSDYWDSLLEWLGDTPLARLIADIIAAVNAGVLSIDAAIEAVGELVNAGVLDIVGAIEGITFPEFKWPEVEPPNVPETPEPPFMPFIDGENPKPVDDADKSGDFMDKLREKAPFAYFVKLSEVVTDIENGVDSRRSWFVQVDIPFQDLGMEQKTIRLDASEWMDYEYNGVSIAYAIRLLLTFVVCFALVKFGMDTFAKMMEG